MPTASTTIPRPPDSPRRREALRWSGWLLLSLLLHALLLDPLGGWLFDGAPPPAPPKPLKVRLAPAPPPDSTARQIVDAPPVADLRPPEKAEFLGRIDQRVENETIAPALGEAVNRAGETPPSEAVAPPAEPAPESESAAKAAPRGQDLARFLPDSSMAMPRATPSEGQSTQRNAVERPTGPVTLLNTKSSPFADYLIARGHRAVRLLDMNVELTAWYAGDLQGLRLPAVVAVEVDAAGRVLAERVESSAGSVKVDRLLLNALRGAVTGTPPPAEALKNDRVEIVLALERSILKIGIR